MGSSRTTQPSNARRGHAEQNDSLEALSDDLWHLINMYRAVHEFDIGPRIVITVLHGCRAVGRRSRRQYQKMDSPGPWHSNHSGEDEPRRRDAWIPVPDPENPFDSWRGCSESPCVSSVHSSAQETAPHTCRGQKTVCWLGSYIRLPDCALQRDVTMGKRVCCTTHTAVAQDGYSAC